MNAMIPTATYPPRHPRIAIGGIGTFLTGKRVIMRCLENWRILATNSGNTTAAWEGGGALTRSGVNTQKLVRLCSVMGVR